MTNIIIGSLLCLASLYLLIHYLKWSYDIILLTLRGVFTTGKVVRFETAGKYDKKWWDFDNRNISKEKRDIQWNIRRHNIEIFPIIELKETKKEIKLRVGGFCKLNEHIGIFIDSNNYNRFYAPSIERNWKITSLIAIFFLGYFGYFLINNNCLLKFDYYFLNEKNIISYFAVSLIVSGILVNLLELRMINNSS